MSKRARIGSMLLGSLLLVTLLIVTIEGGRPHTDTRASSEARSTDLEAVPAPPTAAKTPREVARSSDTAPVLRASTEPTTTARSYLREYWGDRWPEIEQAMVKARIDLDQAYEPVPWEVAAAVLEPLVAMSPEEQVNGAKGVLRWPTEADTEATRGWIRTEFSVPERLELDDGHLLAIADIVRGPNEALGALSQERHDRIAVYSQERWNSGDFVKAPFGTVGVSKALGFYSKTAAASGWSVVITLEHERYPDIGELDRRAAQIREARDLAVSQYLRQQSRR